MDKEFAESYKTSEWQRKKNRILERDNYTCQMCGDTKGVMQVHHITYKHCNGKTYNALDEELITLCGACHRGDDGDHRHFFGGRYVIYPREHNRPEVHDRGAKYHAWAYRSIENLEQYRRSMLSTYDIGAEYAGRLSVMGTKDFRNLLQKFDRMPLTFHLKPKD